MKPHRSALGQWTRTATLAALAAACVSAQARSSRPSRCASSSRRARRQHRRSCAHHRRAPRRTWNQGMVYDNRPGAGGIIAGEVTARATPDGYTLLFSTSAAIAVSVSLYKKLPYDPVKDFAPIVLVATQPYMLIAHPASVASVKELIATAKAETRPPRVRAYRRGHRDAPRRRAFHARGAGEAPERPVQIDLGLADRCRLG